MKPDGQLKIEDGARFQARQKKQKHLFDLAFKLKNAGNFPRAILAFKRIISENADLNGVAAVLIAGMYLYELKDHESALPYAKRAVRLKPKSELASIVLVHCLFRADRNGTLETEIRMYLKTGGKLDHYKTLFEENGLDPEYFRAG